MLYLAFDLTPLQVVHPIIEYFLRPLQISLKVFFQLAQLFLQVGIGGLEEIIRAAYSIRRHWRRPIWRASEG